MSGLKPEVRQLVEAKFSLLQTKENLVKAAVEAEVASGQEAQHIATIEAELTALRLSAGQSQFAGRGRAFTRGTSRGAVGGSGSLTHKQKVSNCTNWIFCFKCKQWGKMNTSFWKPN